MDPFDIIARRFQALAEPTRLRILWHLRRQECSVGELVRLLERPQPSVSKHLGYLRREGFVAERREGAHRYYSIQDGDIHSICDMVCGQLVREHEEVRCGLESLHGAGGAGA